MAHLKMFRMGYGARLPSLQVTIKREGVAQSMSGNTVYMRIRTAGSTVTVHEKNITEVSSSDGIITNATGGVCRFDWLAADFASTGNYLGEFSYANASGKREYCEDIQPIEIYSVFAST